MRLVERKEEGTMTQGQDVKKGMEKGEGRRKERYLRKFV
jgi:hypothetical protein